MEWKIEIYRAFFVAFGFMELCCNLRYLIKENGLQDARKQHKELPANISDQKVKIKTFLMLMWGVLFLIVGLLSYISHQSLHSIFIICIFFFAFYACIEAIYYKYRNTIGFAIISIILLVVYVVE
ncbi:hypothetical protein AB9D59_10985 [Blautia producta]|uniref:hypothetical protein n=1 Tax=Blautia producta TaxID=33035 RepID=UPI000495117E